MQDVKEIHINTRIKERCPHKATDLTISYDGSLDVATRAPPALTTLIHLGEPSRARMLNPGGQTVGTRIRVQSASAKSMLPKLTSPMARTTRSCLSLVAILYGWEIMIHLLLVTRSPIPKYCLPPFLTMEKHVPTDAMPFAVTRAIHRFERCSREAQHQRSHGYVVSLISTCGKLRERGPR